MYCLIGKNSNSFRPILLNSIFQLAKIQAKIQNKSELPLKNAVELLKSNYNGAAISTPYKKSILPYITGFSKQAQAIHAVNTVLNYKGILTGFNTEFHGLKTLLTRLKEINNILVLGAGEMSEVALQVLKQLKKQFVIWNKSRKKIKIKHIKQFTKLKQVKQYSNKYQAIINCFGSEIQIPQSILINKPLIIQLNYYPIETKLITLGKKFDCKLVYGIEMLIEQSIKQSKIFIQHEGYGLFDEFKDSGQYTSFSDYLKCRKQASLNEVNDINGLRLYLFQRFLKTF